MVLSPNRSALLQSAQLFREAVLNVRSTLSPGLASFPAGACADATLLLELFLRQQGLSGTPLRVSTYGEGKPFSHVWLHVGPYHLDVTAAQFDPATPIYLDRNPPPAVRAHVLEPYGTLDEFDEGTQATLRRDYERILAALERRETDRRFWPRQPVKDRWSGMDVLACGHLLTSTTLVPPRARRCPDCAPVLPARVFRAVGEAAVLDWFAALSDEERGERLKRLKAAEDAGPRG